MAVQDVSTPPPHYDITAITLSALLHDVGDRKYVKPGQDSETMIRTLLLGFGADVALATKVQAICSNVSFFEEMKSAEAKQQVQEVIKEHPELTIVQDADRIDSLGAIGIGRVFAYGGAKEPHMSMLDAMNIFNWKLLKVEGEMKTQPGTEMAREATARLEEFKRWWEEEVAIENNYRLTITR